MNTLARLEIVASSDVKDRAYILGEPAALRALANTLTRAANGFLGLESVKLYKSNGHDYEIVVCADISETEWQNLPKPTELVSIKTYDEMVKEVRGL